MKHQNNLDRDATERAAEAWETFHGGEEPSAADHRAFADWMRRSPEHVEAYLRVSRTMQTLRSREIQWPNMPAETLIAEAKASLGGVVTTLHEARTASEVRVQYETRKSRFASPPLAFALAAMLLLALGISWFMTSKSQTFETRFGEQRFVRLDDGSGVTLNTASRIEVRLSPRHRVVRLVQGEALFEVAHDAARPFDVYMGRTILRAVGTRFDVDIRPNHTTVTVVEGIVSVSQGVAEALPLGNTPLLRASDRILIDSSGPGAPVHVARADEVTAWTQQKLVLKARPLGEVADEFNRYNPERILIISPALRAREITGVFKTNDPASFMAFLSNLPGVHVRDSGNAEHIVTLDETAEAKP